MKTTTSHPSHKFSLRGIGMVVAMPLFLLSVYELVFRPGIDAGIWRGLALSSLYLGICLTQRRLFAERR